MGSDPRVDCFSLSSPCVSPEGILRFESLDRTSRISDSVLRSAVSSIESQIGASGGLKFCQRAQLFQKVLGNRLALFRTALQISQNLAGPHLLRLSIQLDVGTGVVRNTQAARGCVLLRWALRGRLNLQSVFFGKFIKLEEPREPIRLGATNLHQALETLRL